MKRTLMIHLAAVALAVFAASGASAATYPYAVSEITGPEIVTGTCAGWGLSSPVGASSCAATTITRTASGANLVVTNAGAAMLGKTYTTSMTITRTAGSVTLAVGGAAGTARSSSATFTQDLTATTDGAVTLTFDAAFDGTITTTVSVKRIQGSSTYTPAAVTTPYDAPDSGGTIPSGAAEVVMSVEAYPIRYLYHATPTATVGVLLPAGSVLKWGPEEFAKFKAIRFIDTAAGAATVSLVYAKGSE
jgi:hypothetical protein